MDICISFEDMSAKAVVTANEGLRGGKAIPLRKTVSEALEGNKCPTGNWNVPLEK